MFSDAHDATFTTWSTFDEFGLRFPEDENRPDDEQISQVEARDWKNVLSLRVGAELHPPVRGLALRAGFVYDRNPSPSNTMAPSLPDSDRIDGAIGAGYTFPCGFSTDLAYMYVRFLARGSDGAAFPGTYRSSAHLAGLSVGYHWDPADRGN